MKIRQANKGNAANMVKDGKSFNLKTETGYISHIEGDEGEQGILTKLIGDKQFFYIEGKWVGVDGE